MNTSEKGKIVPDRIRILIIDDDTDFIQANSIILDTCGFEVLTASSTAEGLIKVAEERPDAVLLDIMMGKTDEGFSVARKIRDVIKSDAAIIMLSSIQAKIGYSFKPEEHPDYFPVDRFLDKPVSPRDLVQVINNVVAKGGC